MAEGLIFVRSVKRRDIRRRDMLHFGIIGLGNIAHRFADSLSRFEEADFYAGASYTESKREEFKKKYKPHIIYDNYEDLLNDQEVDVVYICVPHSLHYKWCKEALLHDKCVLVEKPAVLKVNEFDELTALSRERHLFFMEAMKTRFLPLLKIVHNEINKGLIGDIISISNHFCFYLENHRKDHYLFDKEQGGCLYDTGCYGLASVCDFIKDDVISIKNDATYCDGIDVHDRITLTFRHGQKAFIECAMDSADNRKMIIKGTKGDIIMDPYYRPMEAVFNLKDGESQTCTVEYDYDDFHGEIEAVLQSIAYLRIEHENYTHQDNRCVIELMERIKESL